MYKHRQYYMIRYGLIFINKTKFIFKVYPPPQQKEKTTNEYDF